jgi:hypothetical protein
VNAIADELEARCVARLGPVLGPAECDEIFVEQRPRQQSGAEVVASARGGKGSYRVKLRHGVSRITRGERYTLGIIFHDAT